MTIYENLQFKTISLGHEHLPQYWTKLYDTYASYQQLSFGLIHFTDEQFQYLLLWQISFTFCWLDKTCSWTKI